MWFSVRLGLFGLAVLAALHTCAAVDVAALLTEADAALSRSEYTAAIRQYTSAIELDPSASLLYTKRAAAYIASRQGSLALRDLNRAIEQDDTFVQGYMHRGKLHRQMCNTDLAKRDFSRVLELKPGHKGAGNDLELTSTVEGMLASVMARFDADQLDGLESELQQLFNLAQDCTKGQLLDARLALRRQDWDQVIALTGRLLKGDPSNLPALVMRGQGYFYAGDEDLAKRHFGEALNRDPDYKDARDAFNKVKEYGRKRKKADTALSDRNWAEAEPLYSSALHVDPDHRLGNTELWRGLGNARFHLKLWDSAQEAFRAVLTLTGEGDESAKAMVVRCLLGAEEWQEAVNKAREYVGQHQQNRELHQLQAEADKRLKMSLRKDYYKILGVAKDASERDIKKAYRRLAMEFHPDKVSGTEEEKRAAEDKFRDIAESYEVLSDEDKRRRFDNGQDLEDRGGGGHPGGGHPFFRQGGQRFHFQWG